MLVKLLQWNILFKEDVPSVIETIKELNPDIVNLQELTIASKHNPEIEKTPEYIAKELGYNFYFHEAHRWNPAERIRAIGNGIFTRFPVEESRAHFVREEPQSAIGATSESRVYVECRINTGVKTLTVGNVHLSFADRFEETDVKKKETDELIHVIKDKRERFILSGDFNSVPLSYTIDQISKYLKHCGPIFEHKTWTTKPIEQQVNATQLMWRLDYVFATSDLHVIEARIIKVEYSDHLPILVVFEM